MKDNLNVQMAILGVCIFLALMMFITLASGRQNDEVKQYDRMNITVQFTNSTTSRFGCSSAAYCVYWPENANQTWGCGLLSPIYSQQSIFYNATTIPLNKTGFHRIEANCTDGGGNHFAEPAYFLVFSNTSRELLYNATSPILTQVNQIIKSQDSNFTDIRNRQVSSLAGLYASIFTNRSALEGIITGNFNRSNTAFWNNITIIKENMQAINLTTLYTLSNQSILHGATITNRNNIQEINLTTLRSLSNQSIIYNAVMASLRDLLSAVFTNRTDLEQRMALNFTTTLANLNIINLTSQHINLTTLSIRSSQENFTLILNQGNAIMDSVASNKTFLERIIASNFTNVSITLGVINANILFVNDTAAYINRTVMQMNQSVYNVYIDTQNILGNQSIRFSSIFNNLTTLVNDTSFIRSAFNCTAINTSGIYVCDRLNAINASATDMLSTLADIKAKTTAANSSLKDLIFLQKATHQTYAYDLIKEEPPEQGWEKQYRIEIRGTGLEEEPKVRLFVPVEKKDDIKIEHLSKTNSFDFYSSIAGNYIVFYADLKSCLIIDDLTVFSECPTEEYRIFLKNTDKGEARLYSLAQGIDEKVQNIGFFLESYKWWIMGGILFTLFLLGALFMVVWENSAKPTEHKSL